MGFSRKFYGDQVRLYGENTSFDRTMILIITIYKNPERKSTCTIFEQHEIGFVDDNSM